MSFKTNTPGSAVANHTLAPGPSFFQPKITINQPGDIYEQEADAMAEKVMRMPAPAPATFFAPANAVLQRKCDGCQGEEEEVQRKESGMGEVDGVTQTFIAGLQGGGAPLPDAVRNFHEPRFGYDFSGVKVHTDAAAARSAESLRALAYTTGDHIVFGEGQYAPGTASGNKLLAHELTHTIQQTGGINRKKDASATGGPTLQRAPMPAEATVANLETYAAPTRQNIRYDVGFNLQTTMPQYFQRGIVTTVRSGYNVSFVVRGFAATESWVEPAMRAMALYNFNLNASAADAAITNFTTVQQLDMTAQVNPADTAVHGPNAVVRFTSTSFDATGAPGARTQNVQLLVEKLRDVTAVAATETAAARRTRFGGTYQVVNAVPVTNDPLGDPPEAMTDAQFDQVLEGMNLVPVTILARIAGIPVHRGLTARGPHGEAAEYSQARANATSPWTRKITVYADFFTMTTGQKAFVIIHELGHALDFRPNETATGSGGASLSAATGRGTFREAVRQDGGLRKGMSEYAATTTAHNEYYAEAFTMYINQPDTLRALRPHVFDYFRAQFP